MYYSIRISVFDWLPQRVVDVLKGKALEDATNWVIQWSEINRRRREKKNNTKLQRSSWERCLLLPEFGDKIQRGEKGGFLKSLSSIISNSNPSTFAANSADEGKDGMLRSGEREACLIEALRKFERTPDKAELAENQEHHYFSDFTILRRATMIGAVFLLICLNIYLAAWRKKCVK